MHVAYVPKSHELIQIMLMHFSYNNFSALNLNFLVIITHSYIVNIIFKHLL